MAPVGALPTRRSPRIQFFQAGNQSTSSIPLDRRSSRNRAADLSMIATGKSGRSSAAIGIQDSGMLSGAGVFEWRSGGESGAETDSPVAGPDTRLSLSSVGSLIGSRRRF